MHLQRCLGSLRSLEVYASAAPVPWHNTINVHLRLDDLARMCELRVLRIYGVASVHVLPWQDRVAFAGVTQPLPLTEIEFHTRIIVEPPPVFTE